MKEIKFIFIFFIALFLVVNVYAYQTCDGGYSPYPVKCAGEDSSQSNSIPQSSLNSEDTSSSNTSFLKISDIKEIIWLIAGIIVIIYFGRKLFSKNKRR